MSLTPSQKEIRKKIDRLFSRFSVLILKGDSCSGKHYLIKKYFEEKSIIPIEFSIQEFCRRYDHQITAQDLVRYFDYLTEKANLEDRYEPSCKQLDCQKEEKKEKKDSSKGKKRGSNKKKGKSSSQPSFSQQKYIYLRRIDLLDNVLSDYTMTHRNLTKIVVMRWLESLPSTIKVIISTNMSLRLENIKSWTLDLETTFEDCEYLLEKRKIPSADREKILHQNKSPVIGHLVETLDYAQALVEKGQALYPLYQEAYSRINGSFLDPEKEVSKPEEKFDLIGMEEILEEIRTSIILPIEMGHPHVPVKKGIILTGQPGTGKTTIGRWLAHQLKGKLYLIGGEVGVHGPQFIDIFEDNMLKAKKNAPSVIFIDDVDMLFAHDDTYRAFLTILDGLDNKERKNVCVVVTCMDLSRIPSSLLRGGRLEMTIFTSLPNREEIKKALANGFDRIKKVITEIGKEEKILDQFNDQLIMTLAPRMAGWNCADINRCIDDVLRLILAKKGTKIEELFVSCINSIRKQYERCGKSDQPIGIENYQSYYI